jgi:hypothetical protein|tara:strand:- start:301 stop:507 length:207 start_codon:yes stop_codon:yes gene_type:complete
MIKTSDVTPPPGTRKVRIIRGTVVTGMGRVAVGTVVEVPEQAARLLLAQRHAEPAPEKEIQTRKRKAK